MNSAEVKQFKQFKRFCSIFWDSDVKPTASLMDLDEDLLFLLHSKLQLVTLAYLRTTYAQAHILGLLHSGLWFCEAILKCSYTHASLLVSSAISFTTTWNPIKRPLTSSALPNFVRKYVIPSSTVRRLFFAKLSV